MEKDKIENHIKKIVSLYRDNNKLEEQIEKIFYSPFGAMYDVIWDTFTAALESTSELVGDNSGWISWFIYDNECGSKGLEAGYDRKMKPIKTIKQLCGLIADGGER